MELVVSGWGRDHGEKVIARRDLTEARSSTFKGFERPEVYITNTEGKELWPYGVRAIKNANVEVRFFAKIALNGEYLARLTLTRKEVAKLFLSQYDDCAIEEWLEVLAQVRDARVSRNLAPVMTKTLDEVGLSADSIRLLRKGNIWQVGDLVQKTEAQLRDQPDFDDRTLWEVKDRLTPLGLQLGMKVENWPGVPKVLYRKLDEFELSVRTSNCLRNDNITYIGDLMQKSETEMLRTPNFGRKSLNEITETVLKPLGLELGMEFLNWRSPSE
jgi:DNA-directed RNA polymerase alpha subunit